MSSKAILQGIFDFLLGLTVKSNLRFFWTVRLTKYLNWLEISISGLHLLKKFLQLHVVGLIRGTDGGHFEAFGVHRGKKSHIFFSDSVDGDECLIPCHLDSWRMLLPADFLSALIPLSKAIHWMSQRQPWASRKLHCPLLRCASNEYCVTLSSRVGGRLPPYPHTRLPPYYQTRQLVQKNMFDRWPKNKQAE